MIFLLYINLSREIGHGFSFHLFVMKMPAFMYVRESNAPGRYERYQPRDRQSFAAGIPIGDIEDLNKCSSDERMAYSISFCCMQIHSQIQ